MCSSPHLRADAKEHTLGNEEGSKVYEKTPFGAWLVAVSELFFHGRARAPLVAIVRCSLSHVLFCFGSVFFLGRVSPSCSMNTHSCSTQEREEKCMAGLKDRYRQNHAAILHGQTAFDAVLAEEGEEGLASERDAKQQQEAEEARVEEGAHTPEGRVGAGSAPVTLWPSAPTST